MSQVRLRFICSWALQNANGRDDFLAISPFPFLSSQLTISSSTFHAAASTHCGVGPAAWFLRRPKLGKKLYVGNLSYEVTSNDLEKMFELHGKVESAQVIADRDTGRSKGFGFVEMASSQEAQAATQALNGKESNGRALTVNEARPREERSGSRPSGGNRRY